jgi:hypothetical protein
MNPWAKRGVNHHSAHAGIGNDGGGGKANAEPDTVATVSTDMTSLSFAVIQKAFDFWRGFNL